MHGGKCRCIRYMADKGHKNTFDQIIKTAIVVFRFITKSFQKFIIQTK
jgi:hypothetical protein